jgi:bisphosphoglycerate-dependent phosphoglycerate mutase
MKKRWLEKLLSKYLPAIKDLGHSDKDRAEAQRWATWMKQQWVRRGLVDLKQQRNPMTQTRNSIKEIDPNHVALESMNFTTEEWFIINQPSNDAVELRNENQQLIEDPDAIVDRARELLTSRNWPDVAAGLVVCTGRRSSEILATARFEYKTPFSVIFTGQLKRRGEPVTLSFEIPTLVPAQEVITALAMVRRYVDCDGLNNLQVNTKYGTSVVNAVSRNFDGLVPHRAGKEDLYTHLFRSVYARIATHWFCPPNVADITYMATIQGHYQILEAPTDELRRSYASTRNYFDYKIGDGTGNIDGRQGIKLRQPGIEVLEVFRRVDESSPAMDTDTLTSPDSDPVLPLPTATQETTTMVKRKLLSCRIWSTDKKRLDTLRLSLAAPTQADAMTLIIDLAQRALSIAQLLGISVDEMETHVKALVEQLHHHTQRIKLQEEEIQAKDAQIKQLQQDLKQSAIHSPDIKTQLLELAQNAIALTQHIDNPNSLNLPPRKIPTYQKIVIPRSGSKASGDMHTGIASPVDSSTNGASTDQASAITQTNVGKAGGSAEERIHRAVQAMMNYNDLASSKDNKWAISESVVARLTGSNRPAIRRYFEQHQQTIDQHNDMHGLSDGHNVSKGKRGLKIEDQILF